MSALHPEITAVTQALDAAGISYPKDLTVGLQPVPGATGSSFHLTMRDGVRVAVDLHLPLLGDGNTLPTVVRSTRYWRSSVDAPLSGHVAALEAERWVRHGFALVRVDARGTGASFGTWDRCWDDDQRDDLTEIIDWIISQPWSDGTVGGYGTSYDGTASHLLAATGHPAVRAVVPRFATFDSYAHIAAPGGIPNDWFNELWSAMNWTLDGHPDRASVPPPMPVTGSVRPVDDDHDRSLLAAAIAERTGNWDLWGGARRSETRGDLGPLPDSGMGTPFARIDELRAGGVALWLWSGWYDGGYAAAQLAQFADPGLDTRVTIGPFAHGAAYPPPGDPLRPDAPNIPMADQVEQMAGFLRTELGGVGGDAGGRLDYYRLGDGWQSSTEWPPPNVAAQRLWLGGDGALGATHDATRGERSYDVDFTASTGTAGTRWHTLMGGTPVSYADRAAADEKCLVWDGPPISEPLGITGTAVAHLEVTANAEDFAVHLYLEAMLRDGRVLYITEGELRAAHRKPGTGVPPYETYGPWHSFEAADMLPVTPGDVVHLDFVLNPISILLPAGSRLRIALAAADTPMFRRIPALGEVRLAVSSASWVSLPIEV